MSSKLIVFRVDSSRDLGSGHLLRCLTLARALRDLGHDSIFLMRPLPGAPTGIPVAAGFRVLELAVPDSCIEEVDAVATLSALSDVGVEPIAVVIDAYHLGAAWERVVRGPAPVVVIDDLADRVHECDLLLDQNLHANPEVRYAGLVPEGCRLLIGPRWALLRPEFANRPRPASRDGVIRRLLISYGGSDPTGETLKALRAAATLAEIARIDVVIGPAFADDSDIRAEAANDPRVVVHAQPGDLAVLMCSADLALGGGGSTAWERCYLALPTVVTTVAENQVETARALAARGAVLCVGPTEDVRPEDLARAVRHCLADVGFIQRMSEAAAAVIGEHHEGAAGVASAIMEVASGSS